MADSSDPAFQNLNLPGWGPGRLAVVLVSLSGVAIALAIGSVAAYAWYGEIQRRIERVHPAVLEWSAASVAERVAHASVTIERAGAGIAPYEPGLVERLGELPHGYVTWHQGAQQSRAASVQMELLSAIRLNGCCSTY